jgi:septal ring-binding cell division protein DamX
MKTGPGATIFLIAAVVTATLSIGGGHTQAATQGKGSVVLAVCELLANAKSYAGQTVTLNATLAANEEFSAFTYDSCQPTPSEVDGKHPLIQPSFNEARYAFNAPVNKKLNKILKRKNEARVTVVGVFLDPGHYFGHQLCCRYRLDVLELVSVEQVRVGR